MKTSIVYFIIMLAVLGSCKKDKDQPIKEVPDEIIRTETCSTLYSRIVELFPDKKQAEALFPALFSDTVQKRIVVKEETEVYVTYIAEGALYKNTVGWYSYTENNPPKNASEINLHLLFPNASSKEDGGLLVQGDMLQLGENKFPKGTVIGFFLIVKGWQNGTIDYNGMTHFTDYIQNNGGFQQHILFKEKNCGDIVLGFEDKTLSNETDKDYNDILFTISDNKEGYETISFNIGKIQVL